MNRLGLQGPALKIQPGRSPEGIKCGGIESLSGRIKKPLRPSVERVGETVIRLRRAREDRPLFAAGPSEQAHRQYWRAIGADGHLVIRLGMECASPGKALLREPIR